MNSGDSEVSVAICRKRSWNRAITRNEREWIEVIRLATFDADPPVTLNRVQKLRAIFQGSSGTKSVG